MHKSICNSVGHDFYCNGCGQSMPHVIDPEWSPWEPCPVLETATPIDALDRHYIRAKFDKLRNDLFWEIVTPTEWKGSDIIGGEILRWSGYNDANWWQNCTTDEHMDKTDSRGRVWRLLPKAGIVKLIA